MCTATWLLRDDAYDLFCNRDELRTRPLAEPPARRRQHGVRYLAPRDPPGGGTWIAVNEYGLSLCLLNYYPASPTNQDNRLLTSRGLLVTALVEYRSPDEVARILGQHPLAAYQPFLLLVIAPRIQPMLLTWDGLRLSSQIKPAQPVTTSSFDTARVVAHRRAMFDQLQGAAYHLSHDPAGGACSVCLSRDDAQTVSFSHVAVSSDMIQFDYLPAPFPDPGRAAEIHAALTRGPDPSAPPAGTSRRVTLTRKS